jgi:hypothetical protein
MGSLFILARPGRLASPEREAVSELMTALGHYQPLSIQLGERLLSARSGRSRKLPGSDAAQQLGSQTCAGFLCDVVPSNHRPVTSQPELRRSFTWHAYLKNQRAPIVKASTSPANSRLAPAENRSVK